MATPPKPKPVAAVKPIARTTQKASVRVAPAKRPDAGPVGRGGSAAVTKAKVAARAPGPASKQRAPGEHSREFPQPRPAITERKFSPKAAAPGKSITDQIGGWLDQNIPSRKASEVVTGAMKNTTPVIPYTQKNIQSIKKARP
jgi:hypothetical protein